jgi:AraC-like DNA-binding protein
VAESVYSPGVRQPRHTHDYCTVTVVVEGQLEEETEQGHHQGFASSVVLKGPMIEHDDRISGFGARTRAIRFAPESRFGRCVAERAWTWFEVPAVVRAGLALQRATANDEIEIAAAALIEAVVSAAQPSAAPPAWLASMREILDTRFGESLRFEQLARDFGLHPVYASRAFRRFTGLSMTDYVRAVRLTNARRHLAATRRGIAAIAAESGFADAAHFSRTFSALLGVTPKVYRRTMQG